MTRKKILIFSTAYSPLIGGAEVAVREITDRLDDFDFVMITPRLKKHLPEKEKIGNVFIYRIGKGNNWDKYRLIFHGWKKARELGNFHVVWSIMASYAGFAALRFKKKNPNIPFLLTLQEGDSKWDIYKHVWWCWWYFKQIFKKADKIQTISTYLKRWAESLGATCTIEVIPNGVEFEKFNNSDPEGKKLFLKEKLDIPTDARIIVTISRLVKKNGIGDLIRSCALLSEKHHLVIVGKGKLESRLRACACKLGLNTRVHFVGEVLHSELPQYLWSSDVFCRPSLSEGLGNSFLEAMAAGVPVVGTMVGGISDFLKHEENGLVCEVGNPESIAQQLETILNDQHRADQLRINGLMTVKSYAWNTIAQNMKKLFL